MAPPQSWIKSLNVNKIYAEISFFHNTFANSQIQLRD